LSASDKRSLVPLKLLLKYPAAWLKGVYVPFVGVPLRVIVKLLVEEYKKVLTDSWKFCDYELVSIKDFNENQSKYLTNCSAIFGLLSWHVDQSLQTPTVSISKNKIFVIGMFIILLRIYIILLYFLLLYLDRTCL
jgi:hypothetical protein